MGEPSWSSEAWEQFRPVAGWYRMRRPPAFAGEHWTRRPWLAVLVHYSAPLDPDTGEVLDRAPRWQAVLDGRDVDISTVWPWAARNPVSEAEYEEMLRNDR